jgi:hypothetical protein
MAQLPPNAVPLLRICTKKSRLGFGQYSDLTVGDIMRLDPQYLVWCYGHFDKISFCDEILTELEIPPIPKPGTDERLVWRWCDARAAKFTEEEKFHGRVKKARMMKGRRMSQYISVKNATYQSKAELQAINHGHLKND